MNLTKKTVWRLIVIKDGLRRDLAWDVIVPLLAGFPGQMMVVVNISLRFQNNFLHLNKKFGFSALSVLLPTSNKQF